MYESYFERFRKVEDRLKERNYRKRLIGIHVCLILPLIALTVYGEVTSPNFKTWHLLLFVLLFLNTALQVGISYEWLKNHPPFNEEPEPYDTFT